MQRIKNRLVSFLLRKDKLVAVPSSWQEEYVKLIKDSQTQKKAIDTIIGEYNELLKDFFNRNSVKELQDALRESGVVFKTTDSKEELVKKAYEEFRMSIEKD